MKTNEERKAELFTTDERVLLNDLKIKTQLAIRMISDPLYDTQTVIAGGCFTSWLRGQDHKDIDVFYLNVLPMDRQRIVDTLKSRFIDIHETTHEYKRGNPKVTHVYNSHKSKYQFIFTTNNTREELIKDFDYVHTMVSYHMGNLYLTSKTFDAIKNKHLIVNNAKNIQPWRRTKFISKGWTDPISEGLNEMSEGDFNAIMRQPANAGNWQSAARINPVRNAKYPSF